VDPDPYCGGLCSEARFVLAGVFNKGGDVSLTQISTWIPQATERVSINLVLLVGIFYCAIAVQTTGFGTYKHLFPLLLFQTTIAHGLVGMGIILGIVTGHNNIFTDLKHCGVCGADGLKWSHAIGHIVLMPPECWLSLLARNLLREGLR
jgi:hypothetical protein